MTTVVTMQDPAAVLKKEVIKIEPGQQMADFVPRMMPHFDVRYTSVFLNNRKIELPKFKDGELIDRGDEDTLTTALSDSDVVVIVNEPKGISLGAIIIASLVAAAVTFLMMPSIPGNEAKQSSNNKLFGQTNTARVYDAIPDIYGRVISYPDLITPEDTLYFEANQPQIRQLMCVGIGYYDIPLNKIKLGGTPIGLVPGATVDIYEPGVDGFTTIPNYEWHKSVSEVDGQELIGLGAESYDVPCSVDYDDVTDTLSITASDPSFSFAETLASGDTADITTVGISGTYTLSSVSGPTITINDASTFQADWLSTNQANFPAQSDVYISRPQQLTEIGPFDTVAPGDGFVVDIQYPRGLVQKEVDVTVTYWEIDGLGGAIVAGPFTETVTHYPINVGTFNFDGIFSAVEVSKRTYDQQDRSIFVDVSGIDGDKKYFRVQVRRNNETSDNVEQPDLAKWARLASVHRETERRIQGVTIVDFNLPGTKAAISPRENNLNMEVTRKTISYNLVNGEVVSSLTPSLSFADAVLHEYVEVFQRPASGIDLDELYSINDEINAINSELGEFSFTFDDIDVGLGERIETICAVARVRVYRDGTIWRFSREGIKSVSGQITRKDISSERRYSKTWKPREQSESDSVRVEYTDPDTNKKAYIYRSFSGGEIVSTPGINHLDIKLAGCRNLAQAEDRANLEIRRMLFDGYTVTDTLLIQGNMYDIGQVVEYADVYREDITDGEILDFDGVDVITLSEELDIPSTAFISFTGQFGEAYGPFVCSRLLAGTGKTNKVRVAPSVGFEDVKDEIFLSNGIEKQLGSRYILSTSSQQPPEKYTVNMKEPNNDGTVQLTLTQYDERLFEEGPFGDQSDIDFIRPPASVYNLTAPAGQWEILDLNYGYAGLANAAHISIDSTGQQITVIDYLSYITASDDGGATFYPITTDGLIDDTPLANGNLESCCSSYDGKFICFSCNSGFFSSFDFGRTWTYYDEPFSAFQPVPQSFARLSCNDDGSFIFASTSGGITATSTDGGATWQQGTTIVPDNQSETLGVPITVCVSGDGLVVTVSFPVVEVPGDVRSFISNDGGSIFVQVGVQSGRKNVTFRALNYDGSSALVKTVLTDGTENDITLSTGDLSQIGVPYPSGEPVDVDPEYYKSGIRQFQTSVTSEPGPGKHAPCMMRAGDKFAVGTKSSRYYESEVVEGVDGQGNPTFTTVYNEIFVTDRLWFGFTRQFDTGIEAVNGDIGAIAFNGKDWIVAGIRGKAAISRG